MRRCRSIFIGFCWSAIWCLVSQIASAQLPIARLTAAFPAGGKQGSTIEVTLNGTDLDGANRLYFTHAGITAKQVILDPTEFDPQPRPADGKFSVTIAADVPPGIYEVRVAGKYGLSNPRFFSVDTRPEVNEIEPNSRFEQANEVPFGGIVNGVANGGADQDFFKFPAKQGQRLLIDCQARRIDSRLDPMLVLYDARGNELASAHDGSHRDTLLDLTVPADGDYVVAVHDFVFSGGADYFYRLLIGVGPHIDFVYPPAGLPGTSNTYQIYGRGLSGGAPVEGLTIDGRPVEVVNATIALPTAAEADRLPAGTLIESAGSGIDAVVYRHPSPQGPSNAVLVSLATAPVTAEHEPNNTAANAQKLSPPCEAVGQFDPIGDHDWFTFDAKKSDSYVIEVVSQRLGESTDPYLVVEQVTVDKDGKEQVKELQQADDNPLNSGVFDYDTLHDDPSFRFTAPDDGKYRILVRDLYSSARGDPRFVYRLAIRPEQPDFRLVALPAFPGALPQQPQSFVWSANLRKGGSDQIQVVAFRRDGFDGEIVVSAEGLPAGVTAPPLTIGPGRNSAALILSAADAATASVSPIRIMGKAKIGTGEVTHQARAASIVLAGQPGQFNARSRLSGDVVIAVNDAEPAPYTVQANGGQVLEMSRAGKLEIPVTVAQRGDFKGNVVLSTLALPPGMQPANPQMNVGPGESKFIINLQTNAPLGTFSFHLLGTTQYNYRHNPEAAESAAKRQADIEKIVAERQAALRTANEKKNAANQLAQQTDAEMKRKQQALQTAKKNATDADGKLKAAQEALSQAQAALDKDKQNQGLAASVEAAKKNVAAVEEVARKAAEASAAAEKELAEAMAKAKAAADGKVAADKAATEADAKVKAAEQARQAAVQAANIARNQANPRNINIGFPSTPVTIKVTPAPITIATPSAAALKQGAKLELPVTINRLYGFTNPVQFNVQIPGGVGGLNIPQLTIPANQNQGTLVITAGNNATPGKHDLRLQANLQFNNQGLQVIESVPLTVDKVEAAK